MSQKVLEHITRLTDTELLEFARTASKEFMDLRRNNTDIYDEKNYRKANHTVMQKQRALNLCWKEANRRDIKKDFQEAYISVTGRRLVDSHHPDHEFVQDLHFDFHPEGPLRTERAKAVNVYAGNGSQINSYLRKNMDMPLAYKKASNQLDRIMKPLPRATVLMRGFGLENKQFEAGERFQEKGFLGTTANIAIAKKFATRQQYDPYINYYLELEVPAQTPYVSIWSGATIYEGYIDKEQEILLGRNQTIEFIERKGDLSPKTQHWTARIVQP